MTCRAVGEVEEVGSSFAGRRPPVEARAGADPHRRGGRSCHGVGLAGAPEGEG
jgi:hypothetical protein